MLPPIMLIEAMTTFPFYIDASASLEEARHMFDAHVIRHLPVKEGGALVGLLTPSELAVAGRITPTPNVGEVCRRDVLTVDVYLSLSSVLTTMVERRVDCALVLRHEQLVGIFTTMDACRLLADVITGEEPDPIVA